jgi:hypothetical protein
MPSAILRIRAQDGVRRCTGPEPPHLSDLLKLGNIGEMRVVIQSLQMRLVPLESLDYGWWEAIVLERKDDVFKLQYRDYPKLPKFFRHQTAIALMYSPTEEAKPAPAQA